MTDSKAGEESFARASELLDSGQIEEAYALCRKLMQGRVLKPDEVVLVGQVLVAKGEVREAEEAFRDALRKKSDHGLASLYLASLLTGTNRADEAVVLLRELVKNQPKIAQYWSVLGISLCRQTELETTQESRTRHFQEAEVALRQAVSLGGWNGEIATALAAAQASQGFRGETIATLEEALTEITDSPRDRLRILGDMLLFQILWGREEECERTAMRMGEEGDRDEVSLKGITMRLAQEARQMAGAGPEWQEKALRLADILEGLVK